MSDVPDSETPKSSLPTRRSDLREAWDLIDKAVSRFGDHRLTDWAAALTYYAMLSIFPVLIVIVAMLGLTGEAASDALINNIRELAPNSVREVLISAIQGIQRSDTTAGVFLAVSLLASLYSASSYVGAFMRASNIVWGVRDRRHFWQTIPLRVGITGLLALLLTLIVVAILVTGPLAHELRSVLGLGEGGVTTWDLLKWPIVILLASLFLAVLYNLAPYVDRDRSKLVTPGSVLAVTLWLGASAGFSLYVASFGSINKTYGSLAGVVIFLIWLWLTNVAILLGVELDAELRRYREEHGRSPFRIRRR
ncbi:MAG TPA: YihY/virulence factor BrkB family protein [Solirubrobacterales bacterium]|jgi:membrane protein|nr:YihY/virulence factor BrkB family protein [Solirubrobacterales bacterium]